VVVTPAFKEYLIQNWRLSPEKISIVENGVESDLFSPRVNNAELRRELGAEGKFVVGYIGTMGMAHGLETLVAAATEVQRTAPHVLFLMVGEGSDKERVMNLARSQGLSNMRFVGQQPREKIPDFISVSDACLVLLKKSELFKTVIPTKMLEFMSCARPVILGVDGQARQILEDAGAGIAIEPENSEALVNAISRLSADRELGTELGQRGREHIVRYFSRGRTAGKYIDVLQGLMRHS